MELQWDEGRQELSCYLSQEEGETQVSVKMIEHNQIPGLLPMHRQYIDDQIQFIYEMQGHQSLQAALEELRSISVKWACRILQQIIEILMTGETFFLNMQEYCLVPEYIYFDRSKQRVLLCYLPGQTYDIYRDFRNLMETLMEYLDHRNKQEIELYYVLYQMYCTEEISIAELQEHLERWKPETGIDMSRGMAERTESRNQQKKAAVSDVSVQDTHISQYCFRRFDQGDGRKRKGESRSVVPEEFILQQGECGVGRQQDQEFVLIPQQVSRKHALLEVEQERVYLTDQGSVNGTFVNGRKLSAYVKTRLSVGDVITFADISYHLCVFGDTETSVPPQKDVYKFGRILHMLDDFRLKCPLIP